MPDRALPGKPEGATWTEQDERLLISCAAHDPNDISIHSPQHGLSLFAREILRLRAELATKRCNRCAVKGLENDALRSEIAELRSPSGTGSATRLVSRQGHCIHEERICTACMKRERVQPPVDPYEYRVTQGGRKTWDGEPDLTKEGWELDPTRGRPGESWERFDYHEEMYWRRLKAADSSDARRSPEVEEAGDTNQPEK